MAKKLVEITRHFTYLFNIGDYQNTEFFCSQKVEVPEDEAEKTSEALYAFCKSEVIKSLNAYKKENHLETPREKIIKELKDWFTRGGDNGGPTPEQKDEIYKIVSESIDFKVEEKQIKELK
jgi:hypothetical protein